MNMVECEDKTCRQGTKLYSEECYKPNEEGEYEDDDGQAYMVRCLLLAPEINNETKQHKLFYTRCTIKPIYF